MGAAVLAMQPQTATKHLSLDFLLQTRTDNYVSAGGKEYLADELDALIVAKQSRKAESQLRLWTNPKTAPIADDGMIDIMIDEQTKEDTMAITLVDDNTEMNTIPALVANQETLQNAKRLRSEIDNVCAEMNAFRTELFTAKSDLEDMRVTMADVVAKRNNGKIMKVEVDGIVKTLTREAHPKLADLLINAKLGIPTMLVGPAGCGKSMLAEQLAESLGLEFSATPLTAGASESTMLGRHTPTGFIMSAFIARFTLGGVFCAEEIDAADSNMLLVVNNALANGGFVNPISGEYCKRHKDFIMIACANTAGKGSDHVYVGRGRLDGATLDRFAAGMIEIGYLEHIDAMLCPDDSLRGKLQKAREVIQTRKASEIVSYRAMANCYALESNGVSHTDIFNRLCFSWSKELRREAGLL